MEKFFRRVLIGRNVTCPLRIIGSFEPAGLIVTTYMGMPLSCLLSFFATVKFIRMKKVSL